MGLLNMMIKFNTGNEVTTHWLLGVGGNNNTHTSFIMPWPKNTPSHSISITSGCKRYELSDWLGNVRVVINDRKTAVNSGSITLSYIPQTISVTDYYSFGSEITERSYDPVKPKYRFGFNNKEQLTEIYGKGHTYDFGERIYDARLGRWMSVDKYFKKAQELTPYRYGANNPILYVDGDGNFEVPIHKEITEKSAKLNNLNKSQIESLSKGVQDADYLGFAADLHFDGRKNFSEIQKQWDIINERIKRDNDYYSLGFDIHTVQDFYSHSNYIELYIQYYKDKGGDMSKFSADIIPLYEEGIKDKEFVDKYLKPNLRTGDFNLFYNEKIPFVDKSKLNHNTHYQMNKDSNESKHGKERIAGTNYTYHDIAKSVATRATDKVIKEKRKSYENKK